MGIEILGKMRTVYFRELTLSDYKCFRGEHRFRFYASEEKDYREKNVMRFPRCTVFLGDNGTGKTNLLKVIANLAPEIRDVNDEEYKKENQNDMSLELSFSNGENDSKSKPEKAYRPHVIERHCDEAYRADMTFAFNQNCGKSITNLRFDTLYKQRSQSVESGQILTMSDQVQIGYTSRVNSIAFDVSSLENAVVYAYGVNRFSDQKNNLRQGNLVETLFNNECPLINLNQWLIQLEVAKGSKERNRANKRIELIKSMFKKSPIFPDVEGYEVRTNSDLESTVVFYANDGYFELQELAYGYQCMFAWVFDFVKKMYDRYPDSENPLAEPAILIVDEIDLHLHPEWQRHVLRDLCELFPNTQIIVSTHSPLVIQSMDNINLYVLSKGDDGVSVKSYDGRGFEGWKVEEILREVMQLGDKVRTDRYNKVRKEFEHAMNTGKVAMMEEAYKVLKEIVYPGSEEAVLLDMDYSQLKGETE